MLYFFLEKCGKNKDNGCVLKEVCKGRLFLASVNLSSAANAVRGFRKNFTRHRKLETSVKHSPIVLLSGAVFAALATVSAFGDNLWTFANGTITKTIPGGGDEGANLVWTVPVSWNPATGAMTVNSGIVCDGAVAGDLDLRDATVADAGYAEPVPVTALTTAPAFLSGKTNVSAFFANHVTTLGARSFYKNTVIQDIRLWGESATIKFDYYSWAGSCSALTNAVLDIGLTSIPGPLFPSCASLSVDIATLVKPHFTSIAAQAFANTAVYGKLECSNLSSIGASAFVKTKLQEVVLRGTATTLPTSPSRNGGVFEKITTLTNAVIELPLDTVGDSAFSGCTALACPASRILPAGVTTLGANAYNSCPIYGPVVLTNLASMSVGAFVGSAISDIRIAGELTTLPANSNNAGPFYKVTALTNIVLNCPNFQSIVGNSCAAVNASSAHPITSITFGSTNRVSVEANSFRYQPVASVTFHGPAPELTSLQNILVARTATADTAAKPSTIYASKRQEGWLSNEVRSVASETERSLWVADNPDQKPSALLGVLKRDGNGKSKAYIVNEPSPFDPFIGFIMYLN